ncbi:MAG: hypothetical protein RIT81_31320 [Deltaproteobacteria bacterium]
MAINDFVRQSGDAFVSRLGPKAQTNALDKATVQAEYRAMTEAFTPQTSRPSGTRSKAPWSTRSQRSTVRWVFRPRDARRSRVR